MKNNKYQITSIKGRLPRPGFIACCLLIVLLYACNGGYEPSVGGENTITYEYNSKEKELEVTVNIPSKITYEIDNEVRAKEDYKVSFVPDPKGSLSVTVTPSDVVPKDGSYNISRTTIFTINAAYLTAITVGIARNLYKSGSNDPVKTIRVTEEKITIPVAAK